MPDIEKLRGLIAKWREMSSGDTYRDGVIEFCADELEAAGLPELLADYERLLREQERMIAQVRLAQAQRCWSEEFADNICPRESNCVECEKRRAELAELERLAGRGK